MTSQPVCLVLAVAVVVVPAAALAQERGGLDPASLLEPLKESGLSGFPKDNWLMQ